ncbi:hypothetical protein [Galactobacter valiniphilus]|uniref:hypothetical protein n=1 Tax=Galactobacter valiniphilus TaxID=2676122 RepID=UPI0037360177
METSTLGRTARLIPVVALAASLVLTGCTAGGEHQGPHGDAAPATTSTPPVTDPNTTSPPGATADLSTLRPEAHEDGDVSRADFANAFVDHSGTGPAEIKLPARPEAKVGVTAACSGDGAISVHIDNQNGSRYLWGKFDCGGTYRGSATSTKPLLTQTSTLKVEVADGVDWRVLVAEVPTPSAGAAAAVPGGSTSPADALDRLRAVDGPSRAEFAGEGKPVRMLLDRVSTQPLTASIQLAPRLNTAILVQCTQEASVEVSLFSPDGQGVRSGGTSCLREGGSWLGGSLASTRATLTIKAPDGVGFRVWVWQYRPAK